LGHGLPPRFYFPAVAANMPGASEKAVNLGGYWEKPAPVFDPLGNREVTPKGAMPTFPPPAHKNDAVPAK